MIIKTDNAEQLQKENIQKQDIEEKKNNLLPFERSEPSEPAILSKEPRRTFFVQGLGTIFGGLLGFGIFKSLAQVNASTIMDNTKNFDKYSSSKRLITEANSGETNSKVKLLDKEFENKTPARSPATKSTAIEEKYKNYQSAISVNHEKGVVIIKKDGKNIVNDLEISKLESLVKIDMKKMKEEAYLFNPNKVETLLNDAADLLDRGIKDRNDWDEKAVKVIDLVLELEEFRKLDLILADQEKNGYYEQEYNKAKADFDIQEIVQKKSVEANLQMGKLLKSRFSDDALAFQQFCLRRVNFSSYYYSGFVSEGGGAPAHHPVRFDSEPPDSIRNQVNTGSLQINQFNFEVQRELNQIQYLVMQVNERTASRSKSYLADKVGWEKANIGFKKSKDLVLRNSFELKLTSFLAENGILNTMKRMIPLHQRFNDDFHEALPRLIAASDGLKGIYGYEEPFPDWDKNKIQFFDECVIWLRKAINYLVRSGRTQVVTCKKISLRNYFKDQSKFIEGFEKGVWEINLSKEMFPGMSQVKLVGASVAIVGLHKHYKQPFSLEGCISAEVTFPEAGKYIQKNNKETSIDLLNYPKATSFPISKIYSIDAPFQSEIGGKDIATNMSPIGSWKFELDCTSRPFAFIKNRNGKVKKVSVYSRTSVIINDEDSQLGEAADKDLVDITIEPSKSNLVAFSSSDFFDLRLDLYISYLK